MGPKPTPEPEPPEVLVPLPWTRGTGAVSRDVLLEREREQRAQEMARVAYPRPTPLNGRQMLRKAAVALVEAGLTQTMIVGALAGIAAMLDTRDRPTIVEMMTLVQGIQRDNERASGVLPEPA